MSIKSGDTVICVSNKSNFNTNNIFPLTVGKAYIVIDFLGGLLSIENDHGKVSYYRPGRFRMESELPPGALSPQAKVVLEHLKATGSISQREAILDYAVQSLTRRISELRQAGHKITSVRKLHPITGQRYVRYEYV